MKRMLWMVFSMTKGSFLVSCLSSEPEMSFWKPSNIESKCILSCPLSLSLLPCNVVVLICGVRAEKYSYFVSIFFTVKSVCISRRRRLLSKLWSVRLSRGKTNKQTNKQPANVGSACLRYLLLLAPKPPLTTCLGTLIMRIPGILCMRMFLTQVGILWVLGFLQERNVRGRTETDDVETCSEGWVLWWPDTHWRLPIPSRIGDIGLQVTHVTLNMELSRTNLAGEVSRRWQELPGKIFLEIIQKVSKIWVRL